MSYANDNEMMPEIINNTSAIEAVNRAECDVQIATAKRYPMHSDAKGLDRFVNDAIAMATINTDTAASCMYSLPQGGKQVQGKSIRMAEIVVAAYGNIRAGRRITEIGAREIVAQGVCHDLERNVYTSTEVRRRITTKEGARYSDDMIIKTCNAAAAIAYRNAVFTVVPGSLCEPAYQAARKMIAGDKTSIEIRRPRMIKAFNLMGVTTERLLKYLGRTAIESINGEDVVNMVGLHNSIMDGSVSIDEAFPPEAPAEKKTEAPGDKAEKLADKIKAKRGAKAQEKPADPAPETPTVRTVTAALLSAPPDADAMALEDAGLVLSGDTMRGEYTMEVKQLLDEFTADGAAWLGEVTVQ